MATKGKQKTKIRRMAELAQQVEDMKAEISLLENRYGITERRAEVDELKKRIKEYMVNEDCDSIQFGDDSGRYVKLVKSAIEQRVIADEDDMNMDDEKAPSMTLKQVIEKRYGSVKTKGQARRIWNRVTRRVVKPDELKEVVSEGLLTINEIQPAYYLREKAPYIQTYGG